MLTGSTCVCEEWVGKGVCLCSGQGSRLDGDQAGWGRRLRFLWAVGLRPHAADCTGVLLWWHCIESHK